MTHSELVLGDEDRYREHSVIAHFAASVVRTDVDLHRVVAGSLRGLGEDQVGLGFVHVVLLDAEEVLVAPGHLEVVALTSTASGEPHTQQFGGGGQVGCHADKVVADAQRLLLAFLVQSVVHCQHFLAFSSAAVGRHLFVGEFVGFHKFSVEATSWAICFFGVHAFVTTLEVDTHFIGTTGRHLPPLYVAFVDVHTTELVSVVTWWTFTFK